MRSRTPASYSANVMSPSASGTLLSNPSTSYIEWYTIMIMVIGLLAGVGGVEGVLVGASPAACLDCQACLAGRSLSRKVSGCDLAWRF